MDWTWIGALAAVALNNLVLWVWKPWAGAYAAAKATNRAREEDLGKILNEVREITKTQKVIEAKVSGELWHRQQLWNERRDCFYHLIDLLDELYTKSVAIRRQKATEPREVLRYLSGEVTRVRQAKSKASLFVPSEALAPVHKFLTHAVLLSCDMESEAQVSDVIAVMHSCLEQFTKAATTALNDDQWTCSIQPQLAQNSGQLQDSDGRK